MEVGKLASTGHIEGEKENWSFRDAILLTNSHNEFLDYMSNDVDLRRIGMEKALCLQSERDGWNLWDILWGKMAWQKRHETGN